MSVTLFKALVASFRAHCTELSQLSAGATEKVHQFLSHQTDAISAVEQVSGLLQSKKVIYGFGHRVYKYGDPRAAVFKKLAKELSKDSKRGAELVKISEAIERVMLPKHLYPNVDFYAATCYDRLSIPQYIFTPIFIVARTAGWAAHVIEQRSSNRLIRPASIYNGPEPRKFKAIQERGHHGSHGFSKL